MASYSINALLSMQKSLVQRRQQLEEVKNNTTSRSIHRDINGAEQINEPTYDIKKVDRKIVRINNALFKIDQKIKESNAVTKIDVDIDYDDLSSELE
jgi:septal ring factor EnvC (AmiA/AmiB activator)